MNTVLFNRDSTNWCHGPRVVLGCLLVLFLLLTPVRAAELTDAEVQNHRCLTCHAQSHIAVLSGAERYQMIAPTNAPPPPSAIEAAPRPELYIPDNRLASSVHGKIACVSCHADAKNLPHAPHMATASCDISCHPRATAAFLHSAHAAAIAKGNINAPRCATCHGSHDILPKTDRSARTFPLNIVQTCGSCHQKHVTTTAGGLDGRTQVASYLESVHGQAILKAGLTVSATCADCHSSHDIRPATDPDSTIHRTHVPETCGRCHVGVVETYAKSIHGTLLADGNTKAPVCSDCHTAHAISRTDTPAFMRDIVSECGSCHDKPRKGSREKASLYETYRASYHGQVTNLGLNRAARCSDCHGAHNITRVAADNSPLNATNKVNTCRKCHPGADAKFAGFAPHADFRNSDRYPLLHYVYLYFVVMMSASFGFFGLHCILWAVRSVIERGHHRAEPKPDYSKGAAIQRFNRVDRINHAFVILSFFGLALTGLPLLYSDKAWAQNLAALFGGGKATDVYSFFAVILICNFVVHGVGVYRRFRKHGAKKMLFGPATMLPRKKDLTDLLGMFHWFFLGGKKPKFDRWTYWEKFDYMAEVGGSGIIGLTGLLLWFPVFFSAFVPGWAFNVATIVHGFEALLAVGFIFTIHFFNANLRMEKFPVDDVMFTGRMPEEEFKHERFRYEYDRAVASGEINQLRVKAPPLWYHRLAVSLGIFAMSIGITIVTLIVLAALRII